ncbi:MAG: hypothetical protein WHT09_05145 [Thermogutta sp.]
MPTALCVQSRRGLWPATTVFNPTGIVLGLALLVMPQNVVKGEQPGTPSENPAPAIQSVPAGQDANTHRNPSGQNDGFAQDVQHAPNVVESAIHTRYATAYPVARDHRKVLLVFFTDETSSEEAAKALSELWSPFKTACEAVIVQPNEKIRTVRGDITLRDDPAFAELGKQPGLAIISFLKSPEENDDFGKVVATFTCDEQHGFSPTRQRAIRDTLTSLIGSAATSTPKPMLGTADAPVGSGPESASQSPRSGNSDVALATHLAPIQEADMWLSSYAQGVAQARREKKMLLVYLYPEKNVSLREKFEGTALRDSRVLQELVHYVRVRLPESVTVDRDGKTVRLLDAPSLSEMEGQPGLFIVDYASEGEKYYGEVVSVFPFLDGRPYTADEMLAILTLPPGTLTQRTMVYAVRVHPERPRSILGRPDPYLFSEAEQHSQYQARIRLQGHHFWESRFARIIRAMRGQNTASEVCAESWPGQGLLRAALECVRCWRLSPGHWRAVSSRADAYGYDIKRGSNGVWYATGIFVNR